MALSGRRLRAARFVRRWRTELSLFTVGFYIFVLFPITWVIFPDNNVWLAVLVLVVGLLDEIKDLADQVEDETEDP